MVQNSGSLHHHYHNKKKRKSLYDKFLDKAVYVVSVLGPLMTIPQLLKIWIEKNAVGVSLLSWVSYLVMAFIWLLYGIKHKEKPIILMNSLWVFFEILIVVGILIYG